MHGVLRIIQPIRWAINQAAQWQWAWASAVSDQCGIEQQRAYRVKQPPGFGPERVAALLRPRCLQRGVPRPFQARNRRFEGSTAASQPAASRVAGGIVANFCLPFAPPLAGHGGGWWPHQKPEARPDSPTAPSESLAAISRMIWPQLAAPSLTRGVQQRAGEFPFLAFQARLDQVIGEQVDIVRRGSVVDQRSPVLSDQVEGGVERITEPRALGPRGIHLQRCGGIQEVNVDLKFLPHDVLFQPGSVRSREVWPSAPREDSAVARPVNYFSSRPRCARHTG